jgi:hypothetical protein
MTKKKRQSPKKTQRQVIKSVNKQRQYAHTRMFDELLKPLAKMRETAEDLESLLPRFKRLSLDSRRILYEMIVECDERLSSILDLYYDTTAGKSESPKMPPRVAPMVSFGIIETFAKIFDKVLTRANEMDEFPDELDISPEPKLLTPGEDHDD